MFEAILNGELSEANIEKISKLSIGTIPFSDVVGVLNTIRRVLLRTNNYISSLAINDQNNCQNLVSQIRDSIIKISTIDPAMGGDVMQQFSNSLTNLRNYKDQISRLLSPLALEFEEDASVKASQELYLKASKIFKDLENIENLSKGKIGLQATNESAEYFRSLGTRFQKKADIAKKNLWISALVFLLIISFFSIWIVVKHAKLDNAYAAIPLLNVIALGWFAMRILSKDYRSNSHLAITNLTKATIIDSGQKFIASLDMQERNIVTEIVVSAAYSVGDTGLISSDGEQLPTNSSQMISRLLMGNR